MMRIIVLNFPSAVNLCVLFILLQRQVGLFLISISTFNSGRVYNNLIRNKLKTCECERFFWCSEKL
jgi:ABC-type antimicrobial peptide transport system permease subunit